MAKFPCAEERISRARHLLIILVIYSQYSYRIREFYLVVFTNHDSHIVQHISPVFRHDLKVHIGNAVPH